MFSSDDTIVAISTPPGRGGIGVVRLSGADAGTIARGMLDEAAELLPRHATLGTVVDAGDARRRVDRVLATYFPGPHSYTGEDVVEISGHGNPVLLGLIVEVARRGGARLAQPGEFTLRAFLRGRVDLTQAEAVGDLVSAVTPLQARAAFDQLEGTLTTEIADLDERLLDLVARLEASVDFPDEGYHFADPDELGADIGELSDRVRRLLDDAGRGRLIREGGHVVVVGKPNVGKSTLFNRLLGASRAIVTSVSGTTRDLLTETLDLAGVPVTLVDTAGIRSTDDAIEAEGVNRARGALGVAELVVLVLDRSRPLAAGDRALLDETSEVPRVVVVNKVDLPAAWAREDLGLPSSETALEVSLRVEDPDVTARLCDALAGALVQGDVRREPPRVTNQRHIELLERAETAMRRAAAAAVARASEELVLADLVEVQQALGEVTGARTADDVLAHIFSTFCIGK